MHNLLSKNDVYTELGKHSRAQPCYIAQDPTFPLTYLTDRQFELLAHLLLDADIPNKPLYDSSLLLSYGADEGRDVVLYKQELPVGVVQCKRYAKSIGIGDVLEELYKFLLFALRDPALMPQAKNFRYEFWTARDLTKEAGNFFKEPRRYFDSHASTLVEHVAAARKACKALQQPAPDGTTPDEEARQVIAIGRELCFAHVGQTEISQRLIEHTRVRRWFFRSPEDVPGTPSDADVEALLANLASQAVARYGRIGNLVPDTYIPSAVIAAGFAGFLESGERMFVLTGGSGHGKSTWSASLLTSPPPGWTVTLVKGEDIAATDINIVETLARLLKANAVPAGLTVVDMTAAVWRWLERANHLLVVDGLDRVPTQARDNLPTWIENSAGALARYPTRLVLVSRNEEWRRINSGERHWAYQLCHQGLLSDEEAAALYHAYGLAPIHHLRPLRTPSLIRRLSRLKGELGGPVTRARLLETSMGERSGELAFAFGTGPVDRALAELSIALAKAPDVRIRAAQFQNDVTLSVIDGLHRNDVLVSVPNGLRPESDDIAEYLIALELDIRTALDAVAAGRTDPIFLGAIAIAPQLSGRQAELPPLLDDVLPRIHELAPAWYELVVRIMIEVEDHASHLPVLRRLFDEWQWNNVVLLASNLHELMDDLRLPLADRFDLLMRLAHREEMDDWRTKFWVYPDQRGRIVTPFAATICATVRSHPRDSLVLLEALLRQPPDNARAAVATALLYEAATVALPETLLCCMRLGETGHEVSADLAFLYPLGFLQHALRCARASVTAIDVVVDHVCKAVLQLATSASQDEARECAAIIGDLLALAGPGRARLRLLLCSLTMTPNAAHLDELFGALDRLHWSDIWWLVKVAGPDAEVPLRAVFSGALDQDEPFGRLARLDPWSVSPVHWPLVTRLLAEVVEMEDARARRAAAEALEMILHRLGGQPGEEASYRAFMPLARKLASDPVGRVRGPLLYYGTSIHSRALPGYVSAFRTELASLLVAAEDGTTLDTLRQKLYEHGPAHPHVASFLQVLEKRFGAPPPLYQELYDLLARIR